MLLAGAPTHPKASGVRSWVAMAAYSLEWELASSWAAGIYSGSLFSVSADMQRECSPNSMCSVRRYTSMKVLAVRCTGPEAFRSTGLQGLETVFSCSCSGFQDLAAGFACAAA